MVVCVCSLRFYSCPIVLSLVTCYCTKYLSRTILTPFASFIFHHYRQQRLYTGILSAVFSGFLVFTYLEPLFVPVGTEPAMVFLYILCIHGALVGMSLGVLLPVLFPGVCLGGALALLVAALWDMQSAYFFPAFGGVLAVLSAVLSARYVPTKFVLYVSMCTM